MAYDRYSNFRLNGKVMIPPSVKIPVKSSDFYEVYRLGSSRLDLISNDYYGDPGYDWLILMANPSLSDLEYNIPDGTIIRIPYPLNITLDAYNREINNLINFYGLN